MFKGRKVVCLCGSVRFMDAFAAANERETLDGNIVLSVGASLKDPKWDGYPDLSGIKERLDELHFDKIELADEILVLNVGGYIGDSTANEIKHAIQHGKRIRFLEGPTEVRDIARRSLCGTSPKGPDAVRRYYEFTDSEVNAELIRIGLA